MEATILKLTQGAINAIRNLLSQSGYTRDFGDFYDAARSLSILPKAIFPAAGTTDAEIEKIMSAPVDVTIEDKTRDVIKLALRHYIAQKKEPYREFFEIVNELKIDLRAGA